MKEDKLIVALRIMGGFRYVIHQIRKQQGLKHLIYISCNISGAGQNVLDLLRPTSKRLKGDPFRLVKALPVDLFPHTDHCELVLVFERGGGDRKGIPANLVSTAPVSAAAAAATTTSVTVTTTKSTIPDENL